MRQNNNFHKSCCKKIFQKGEMHVTHIRFFKLNETMVINLQHNIQISRFYTVKYLLINVNFISLSLQ